MTLPNLKRIKISDLQGLERWLRTFQGPETRVILITNTHTNTPSYDEIQACLANSAWSAGRRYTVGGGLLGHIITKGSGT